MQLFDTHCHIHEIVRATTPVHDKWIAGGVSNVDEIITEAQADGVTKAICVGTTLADSALAVEFVQEHEGFWASIGIHPHEAKEYLEDNSVKRQQFAALAAQPKVVAIGECGLDYFYGHSPKADQIAVLRFQIDLALKHDLPLIFHVRDAFDDFWPIFDEYRGIRGVIHSFSTDTAVLDQILSRGLYVGLNGIMTFTKRPEQLAAAKAVPLDRLLLETDAPYLTPVPYRGTINRLKYVKNTAEFLAELRGEPLQTLADTTTVNAQKLFNV